MKLTILHNTFCRALVCLFASLLLFSSELMAQTQTSEPKIAEPQHKAPQPNVPRLKAPKQFKAIYKADYKGLPISAKGIRELSKNEDGSFTLSSIATSLFASITETSKFKLEDHRLVPLEYQYHRSGIGKKRDATLTFDWQDNSVLNNVQGKPWKMDVPTDVLDKLLYQFKMREDLNLAYKNGDDWPALEYTVADGGKLKTYSFEVIGEEVLETPVGRIRTVKATRVRDDSDRISNFWLAPDYEFLLIRFEQLESDGGGFELMLRSGEFDGKSL